MFQQLKLLFVATIRHRNWGQEVFSSPLEHGQATINHLVGQACNGAVVTVIAVHGDVMLMLFYALVEASICIQKRWAIEG